MKKMVFILMIFLLLSGSIYSKNLKLEKEIDLSFFLKPHQPHLAYVAIDSQGFIFITQRGKDLFLKLDQTGEVLLKAPQKIEGEITRLDLDHEGNVVCLLSGRMTGNSLFLPLVWFDGISGQKIREINLGEKFNFVAHLKILKPNDLILVNGIVKDERPPRNSLHLVDFNLNLIKSFSPLKEQNGDTTSLINMNPDHFASSPKYDSDNSLIFQAFPSAGLIKCFDLNGNQVAETEWVGRNLFIVQAGELWIKDDEGFSVFKKKGNRFEPEHISLKDDQSKPIPWYPVAQDANGRFYFLGDKTFQTLKIYLLEK